MIRWPFPDPPETTVLTLRSILQEGRPIRFVEHDENGGWYFFDQRVLFPAEELVLARLGQVVETDPRLAELADLPAGWRAWRTDSSGPWERESRAQAEKTRARVAKALAELKRTAVTPPPDLPGTTEMLREDRER